MSELTTAELVVLLADVARLNDSDGRPMTAEVARAAAAEIEELRWAIWEMWKFNECIEDYGSPATYTVVRRVVEQQQEQGNEH